MEKQKKYPQLRFNSFNGEWRINTINQLVKENIIAKPIDGNHGNIHPKATDYVPTGIPFIMACDIKDGDIDLINCKFIKKEQADKLQKGFARSSDILLTHKGSIGGVTIVPENVDDYIMLTPQVTYYRVLNHALLINTFLRFYFNSSIFQKQLKLYSDSGTRPYIGITEQRNLHVSLPLLPEQQKIASFFTAIDQKISQLKRKKNLLEQYKKGLMQKIFSQENRFKDESGQEFPMWDKKKLGDVFNITSSKRVFQDEWTKSGVPFYRAREIVKLSESGYVDNELFISNEMYNEYKSKYGVPQKNDLLVTGVGTIGVLYVVKENEKFYFKDGNIIWFKSSGSINSQFVKFLFQTRIIRKQLEDNASITTVGTYTIESANKTVVPFPNIKEQTKIANFLSAIDDKINRTQKQIGKAEVWKKGLMQQMFC